MLKQGNLANVMGSRLSSRGTSRGSQKGMHDSGLGSLPPLHGASKSVLPPVDNSGRVSEGRRRRKSKKEKEAKKEEKEGRQTPKPQESRMRAQVAQAQAEAKELLKKMPLPKGETPKKEKPPKEAKEVPTAAKENESSAAEATTETLKRSSSSGKVVDQATFMAMVKKSAAMFSGASLEIHVDGDMTAKCKVRLKRGKKDGRLGKAGGKKGARTMSCCGDRIAGTITIEGIAEPIPFGVDPTVKKDALYIYEKHRRMATVLSGNAGPEEGAATSSTPASSAAAQISVDVTMEGSPKAAKLMVTIRASTEVEKRRDGARVSLKDAEGGTDYQRLHGQIAKARQSGVDASDINRAQAVLKTLKPDTLDKDEITSLMAWDKVSRFDLPVEEELCQASAGCGSNEAAAAGEEIEFRNNALVEALTGADCLKGVEDPTAEELGKGLFESIVQAALSFPEGSVWKAGGKFILSHPDRNQSPAALLLLLTKHGKAEAAELISRLIQWTEKDKKCVVTACQLNLHANEESFHAQHRDIFSVAQKEKAGRDCTCSFTTCIGTMCFSIGSSRQMQLSTMVDSMSEFEPCCEACTGHKERRFFQNGEAMWFNDVWNKSHTHGVPMAKHLPCGPRISIAMLCAAKPVCRIDLSATANGVSSTAVLNQKFF